MKHNLHSPLYFESLFMLFACYKYLIFPQSNSNLSPKLFQMSLCLRTCYPRLTLPLPKLRIFPLKYSRENLQKCPSISLWWRLVNGPLSLFFQLCGKTLPNKNGLLALLRVEIPMASQRFCKLYSM